MAARHLDVSTALLAVVITALVALCCSLLTAPVESRRSNIKNAIAHVAEAGLIYPVIVVYVYLAFGFLGDYIK